VKTFSDNPLINNGRKIKNHPNPRRRVTPVIPRRETSKERGRFFPKRLYKLRARIEQTIGKLKRFKRIALRCDKTIASFAAFTSFACCVMLIKSVHTA